MSRRKPADGFGERVQRLMVRLELDVAAVARAFDVAYTTASGWVNKSSSPAAKTLKLGIARLEIPDGPGFLWWLADGEGSEPGWLSGTPGSPLPPDPPRPGILVAMPNEALEAGRDAFRVLDGARAANGLREDAAMQAFLRLKSIALFRSPPASAEESSSPPESQVSPVTLFHSAA